MYVINDSHTTELDKAKIDSIYYELNKELRKKMRKYPQGYKAELYVVGGACAVCSMMSRYSTLDIDAVWNIGSTMRDCINIVGDRLGLGHTFINCNFKQTKSYTNAIYTNSSIYVEFDRLVVRMVNLDLLLCMKLIAFREKKQTDIQDCNSIISIMKNKGVNVTTEFIVGLINKYYGSLDILSDDAKKYIGVN